MVEWHEFDARAAALDDIPVCNIPTALFIWALVRFAILKKNKTVTTIATTINFVYFRLLHSNGQEYAKRFHFTFEMVCTCAKNGFSNLSCNDKTTNYKSDKLERIICLSKAQF